MTIIPNLTARQNHSQPTCIARLPSIRSGYAPLVETRKALSETLSFVSKFRKTRASRVPDSRQFKPPSRHCTGFEIEIAKVDADQASIGLFKRSLGGKPKQLAHRMPPERSRLRMRLWLQLPCTGYGCGGLYISPQTWSHSAGADH